MNGVHDMGGMENLGRVAPEAETCSNGVICTKCKTRRWLQLLVEAGNASMNG